ncbi:MAG: hypothetical protein QXF12_00760 [Candidatus Aenigmatarchaeota archaeon]
MRYILFFIFSLSFMFSQMVVLHKKDNVFWQKNNKEKIFLNRLDTVYKYGFIVFENQNGYLALYDPKKRKAFEFSGKTKMRHDLSILNSNDLTYNKFSGYILSYPTHYYSGRSSGVTLGAVSRGLHFVNIVTPKKTMFYSDSIIIRFNRYHNAQSYKVNLIDYNGKVINTFFVQDTFIHINNISLNPNVYYYYEILPVNESNNNIVYSSYKQSFFINDSVKENKIRIEECDLFLTYQLNKSYESLYNLIYFYYMNRMYYKLPDLLKEYDLTLYFIPDSSLILVRNSVSCISDRESMPFLMYDKKYNADLYFIYNDNLFYCSDPDYYNFICPFVRMNLVGEFKTVILINRGDSLDYIEHIVYVQ